MGESAHLLFCPQLQLTMIFHSYYLEFTCTGMLHSTVLPILVAASRLPKPACKSQGSIGLTLTWRALRKPRAAACLPEVSVRRIRIKARVFGGKDLSYGRKNVFLVL